MNDIDLDFKEKSGAWRVRLVSTAAGRSHVIVQVDDSDGELSISQAESLYRTLSRALEFYREGQQ